VYVWGEGQ
jgi:alpha-tubulin suppressor-like RCC1 family protein